MFINEKITILYGSQTGNAQDLAERIWHESKRYYFITKIKSMDDYNIVELINENCVIFICSTTGQGDVPDNMKQFWKFLLRKNLPLDSLNNLKFAVFGLGDSSYVKFNFAAKRLFKRLQQLGGQPLLPLGLGDDQHDLGYDGAADPWVQQLWVKLMNIYPLPNGVQPLDKNLPILPRWSVIRTIFANNANINSNNCKYSLYESGRQPGDFHVTVLENSRITANDHFQDVRLIKFQTNGQLYNPGDVLVLRPKNLQWQIDEFKSVLGANGLNFNGQQSLQLKETDTERPLPLVLKQNLTFDQLCMEYFDLMAIPRRSTFQILSQLTDSELEKEKCLEFTMADGQQDLYTYCNRPKRNIVEVLQDFPNATKNLTLDILFEIIPQIKPREFSIASSYKFNNNQIHILVAVVKYKTKLVKERFGLCSNYLADLKPGDELLTSIKTGSLHFPTDPNIPVIMVGPGTGLAPFRNFIYNRVAENSAMTTNLLLFFGCRHPDKDFHCKDDLIRLQNDGKLHLITAFSRLHDNKIYVQDKIRENHCIVWEFLQCNGSIFIAGNAKLMPQQVREAFIDVCCKSGGMSVENAERFIDVLEKQNRYQTECWS